MKIAFEQQGRYLTAEPNGTATWNRHARGAWETWTVEPQEDGTVALRAWNDQHLCAELGGGEFVNANRQAVGPWERFTLKHTIADGSSVLVTEHGAVVCAGPGPEYRAVSRAEGADRSAFTLVVVEADPSDPVPGTANIRPRVIDGRLFRTDDGQLFRYVGWSDFALLRKFSEGGEAAIADVVTERRALFGPNRVARVFRYAGNNNAFALAPAWDAGRLDLIVAFLRYMARRGCYVMLTAGDAQFVLPNQADQQREVNAVYEAIENEPNVDFQTCNEDWKNGVDTKVVRPRKGKVLRSSGHYTGPWGDASFEGTLLDFLDYHSVRSGEGPYPKWIWDPPEEMYDAFLNAPIVGGEERGAAEQNEPGRRSNERAKFFKLGVERLLWDVGVIFHSTAGISSSLFPPVTKGCAEDFGRGVRLIEANS